MTRCMRQSCQFKQLYYLIKFYYVIKLTVVTQEYTDYSIVYFTVSQCVAQHDDYDYQKCRSLICLFPRFLIADITAEKKIDLIQQTYCLRLFHKISIHFRPHISVHSYTFR